MLSWVPTQYLSSLVIFANRTPIFILDAINILDTINTSLDALAMKDGHVLHSSERNVGGNTNSKNNSKASLTGLSYPFPFGNSFPGYLEMQTIA